MKNTIKNLLLISIFLFTTAAVVAQNYGHMNFSNMVANMPETKIADIELEEFQNNLVHEGEVMAEKFQKNYASFAKNSQNGDMPPRQQEEWEHALKQEEQKIMAYEQEVNQRVQQKRNELLEPIVKRVQEAIAVVARENGFEIIFDTSVFNAVLEANKSTDISALVKAKLGI